LRLKVGLAQELDLVEPRLAEGLLEETCGRVKQNGAGSLFEKASGSSTVTDAKAGCFSERRFGMAGSSGQSGSGRRPFVP